MLEYTNSIIGKDRSKMKHGYLSIEKHGFYGAYYPNPKECRKAVILMLGDKIDDNMVKTGAKWLHRQGCNVLTMAPETNDYAFHDYKIEYFERAIRFLRKQNNEKFGICGASTTGMAALAAASLIPDLTLTIALSPSDFIMEGFYRDGLDGARERPGNGESSLSYHGKGLTYLPYAYRHPEYWQKIEEETKRKGQMIASRDMFDRSEELCPVTEEMKIKVENSKGKLVFIGAEDDCLWDTCKYIRRMVERLEEKPHSCGYEALLYEHGTHFVFPQSMLEIMLPLLSAPLLRFTFKEFREFPNECKATRIDIDNKLKRIIAEW